MNHRTEETQLIVDRQIAEVAHRNGISVDRLIIEVFVRARVKGDQKEAGPRSSDEVA